jgi:hypothetical protein
MVVGRVTQLCGAEYHHASARVATGMIAGLSTGGGSVTAFHELHSNLFQPAQRPPLAHISASVGRPFPSSILSTG